MAKDLDVQRAHIRKALERGSFDNSSHSYEWAAPFLFYYVQGMLMSVWHRPTGRVDHIPLLWEQDEAHYRQYQVKFERAVAALEERMR